MGDFEDRLTKAKEQRFKESVLEASEILDYPPKVEIGDGKCPHSSSEIAHAHPDIGLICISRSRLKLMTIEEIEETAFHETVHMLYIGHDVDFHITRDKIQSISWLLSHKQQIDRTKRRKSRIELKRKTKLAKNMCNYHLCNERDKLKKCPYCGGYFCKKHIKPKMALTLHQVSTTKEPLRRWLEKEYRDENGHPDWPYTRIAWQKLEKRKAEQTERFLKALDRLKERWEREEEERRMRIQRVRDAEVV